MVTARLARPDCLSCIDVYWEICWEVAVISWLSDLHKSIEAAFALAGRNQTSCHYAHLQ